MSGADAMPATRTRRELLRAGAGSGLAGAAWWALGCGSGSSAPPRRERIVVVGGGLAGLTCAHRLRQAGHHAIVHEAAHRLGGRCWTIRGVFAEGQIAEHGGELIDTDQKAIRALVDELGLRLENVVAAEKPGTHDVYWIDGGRYPFTEATADFRPVYSKLHRDLHAAGYPTFYDHHTKRGVELDRMSILEYIDEIVPGGHSSRLGQLLNVGYNTEFGGQIADQSALNLLYLLGYSGRGRLRLFGTSNERFHVDGGNDLIVRRLAERLHGQIETGSELTAIRRRGDGWELAFDRGSGTETVRADHVVLALPFTLLREVDYSDAGFSALKREAIEELGMGTNSKLNVQFSDRHWRALGSNGSSFADTGYQSSWEPTRGQPGRAGILVEFTGGKIGDSFGGGSTDERARRFISQLDPVIPGLESRFNGRAVVDFWADDPWTRGSYAYYRVGQMTRFGGIESKPSGSCYFAGEHTAYTYQGYLEGAVRSGERVAGRIAAALR